MRPLPEEATRVLERGTLCYVAADTPSGPHLTPLVFAVSGGRLWLTTSRRSVKARAWARDPAVAGLVRSGGLVVSFAGSVRTYDALDPDTWVASVIDAPAISLASARFTRKNARFFAGYAVDAHQLPLAWTPPGRVFVGIGLERVALLEGAEVRARWGRWGHRAPSRRTFRASRQTEDPLAPLPGDVLGRLGRSGQGAVALRGTRGTVVLPAGWAGDGHALFAALSEEVLSLADCQDADVSAALAFDRASWWRARKMVGVMVQGTAGVFVVDRLASGAGSAQARMRLAGADADGGALLRVAAKRLVWWRGWASGTVSPP